MARSCVFRIGLRVCVFTIFSISLSVFLLWSSLLKYELLRTGALTEGSLAARLYETIPFDVRQNVYVFNITNRKEFLSGAKPRFEQLGPYTFNLTLRKEMSWAADGSLSYKERRIFMFKPELSTGQLSDRVYTVDPVYTVALSVIDTLPAYLQAFLRLFIKSRSILFERTVDEILYSGYSDPLANIAHLFKKDLPVIDGKIGYLRALNNSDDGSMTVYSGDANTLRQRNEVFRWMGQDYIPHYAEPCNKLYGENGELFPAFDLSAPPAEIHVFQPMFCRPWTLHFNGSSRPYGVVLAKFNTRDDIFSPTGDAEFDRCLQPRGWPRGVFDISDCQHGFPALISLPHFLRAEECLEDVEGLEPDPSLHDFEMEIYALLGIPVRPAIRAQINVRIQRKFSPESPALVYPILWQEIVLAEQDSEYLSSIIYYALSVPSVLLCVILFIISSASLLFLIIDIRSSMRKRHGAEDDERPIWSSADILENDTTEPAPQQNPDDLRDTS
ncbi:scavenger receptor class B member 1 [Galendromus occidentalis]|uniref:Scavenger receptor class B member 1 n=1 Tax=Galendromus occidentalis TaxID=34638 RepID=A0AAJ6QLY5_9ACAR|nr:scavenger receptor class B member 1 [Galendromus occidentalis]